MTKEYGGFFFILTTSYHIQAAMYHLGIDYGHKKVGLAISDESGRFAFPYGVLPNTVKLSAEIRAICEKEGIEKIVIGESLNLSGEPNPIQKKIKQFRAELAEVVGLPVASEKEFFTSWEAKRLIDEEQKDPLTDARAAALILRSYLDKS